MIQASAEIQQIVEKVATKHPTLSGFSYENGYTLLATDLGNQGVKIELMHNHDTAAAIILPPKEVGECGRWLLHTIGQDRHGMPKELQDILKRLNKQKGFSRLLKRGEKKAIQDSLKILKSK